MAVSSGSADLVPSILRAHQKTGVLILTTPPARPVPERSTKVGGKLPLSTPPPPVPLTAGELEGLLLQLLPRILTRLEQARSAAMERKPSLNSALACSTTLMASVSLTVHRFASQIQGESALALVTLMFRTLHDRYVVSTLPPWLRPFGPLLRSSAVDGLEIQYRGIVKGQF